VFEIWWLLELGLIGGEPVSIILVLRTLVNGSHVQVENLDSASKIDAGYQYEHLRNEATRRHLLVELGLNTASRRTPLRPYREVALGSERYRV
jgi:hypothetical protein